MKKRTKWDKLVAINSVEFEALQDIVDFAWSESSDKYNIDHVDADFEFAGSWISAVAREFDKTK